MGLAGQKNKQRISADPNNLNWSRDQTKFGFKMLEKMGWTPGKGLGVNEDGRGEHVKVRFKQDALGVGADKRNCDNWLESTEAFTRLLNELNEQVNCKVSDSENKNMQKKEKRRSDDEMEVDNKKEKKDKKKKKKEHIMEKRVKKSKATTNESNVVVTTEHSRALSPALLNPTKISQATVRFASRAKFRRNKSVSSYSAEDLNKILGIKSYPSYNNLPNISSIEEDKVQENIVGVQFEHKQISAVDYFAERLKNMNATRIAVTGLTLASQRIRPPSPESSPSPDSLRPSFSFGSSMASTESLTLLPKSASPYTQKMNFQLSTTTDISTLNSSTKTVNNNDVCAKESKIKPQKNKKRKAIVAIDSHKKGKKTKIKEMEEQKAKKNSLKEKKSSKK